MVKLAVAVTVLVPNVTVAPEALEVQFPLIETADAPILIVPPAGEVPLMVTPPPVRARPAVLRVVVLDVSVTVSNADADTSQRRPRVAMVNVCAVPALDANVTLLNSASARFAPANVIVPPVALSKITVPVPASHAASVVELVHVPLTVHVSEPKSICDTEFEMLTEPVIDTSPDVEVRSPPDIVRLLAVMVNVVLTSVPLEISNTLVTMSAVASVTVPAPLSKSSNVLSVASIVMVASPNI